MKKKLIRNSDVTISTQLYEMLRQDILENKWKENDKFYSVRQISIKYEVNLNTVLKVIRMLEEEGYLYSVKGKGCFVKKGYNLDIGKRMTPILNTFRFGQNSKDMEINFSNGGPPKECFPIEEYKEIVNEILSDEIESRYLMAYQNIQGLESLRETLAEFIIKYGIRREKDDIIICSGTQIALELISTAFGISPKKTVLLSDPTYQNAVHILKSYCNIENIDMKCDGWDMQEFENLLKRKKIDFVYIMTNFQNPTGVSWSFEYIDSFSLNKYFIDTTTSGINQKFLEIFIKRGLLDKHLEQLRLNLKRKMEYIISELQKIKHLEIMHIPKGGFFIWVNLANYINSEKFYYKCRLRGLSVLPGFIFYSTSEETTSKIRISIVSSSIEEMKKGLEIIQDVLNNCDFKL